MPLSESDTRSKLIDPAIHQRGWTEDLIRREEAAGAVEIINGKPRRRAKGRVDYTLRIRVHTDTQPVAVALIEAKAENLPPNHGLEQVKAYATSKRLNVPFVFASNGHLFVEYDRFTGLTSQPCPLADFPSPAALRARYEQGMKFSLDDPAAKPLLVPYRGGEAQRRYYQDAAIRAVFEKIAQCETQGVPGRALLTLATGAGKTYIAVQILKRIADAGQLRQALFICDRDELRTQGHGALHNVFSSDAAIVTGSNAQKNARILVATYQTLGIDGDDADADASFLTNNYPQDYFSHIIIDECHRSAWGKWSEVLKRNPNAVQIGLTATPRKLKMSPNTPEAQEDEKITANNVGYFGEPVYEYELGQGIDDGYLAACEILKGNVNLDNTGITIQDLLKRNPKNAITGQPLTEAELRQRYEKGQYEQKLLLPDRVLAMCQDLFNYFLQSGGPEQKTVIFCAGDRHADEVAATMNNLYAAWCHQGGHTPKDFFAFKCTAAGGKDYLPDLRSASRSHFIATTVDLLTTGVDVPWLRNIVFFKYVKSPISFYQMVGRGTRLDPASGKLMFRIYDYTNATSLFGEEFITATPKPKKPGPDDGGGEDPEAEPPVVVEGFDVVVTPAGHLILTNVDGSARPVTLEEYRERLAAALVEEVKSLGDFRARWISPRERRELLGRLPDGGRAPLLLRELQGMQDCDLFDVLADLAFGQAPRTRQERAESFGHKHGAWLATLPQPAALTLEAMVRQFAAAGTDGLENPNIFKTPTVIKAGGLAALQKLGSAAEVLRQTKERIFAA